MRWGRYTVVGERSETFGRKIIFEHAQKFFLGPTFSNVWAETLQNVCKTLCIRYEIVQFIRLSFRMRLAIVRKRWHSFALYVACYKGWADQFCATKPLSSSSTPGSVILQSCRGFLATAMKNRFELEAASPLQENRCHRLSLPGGLSLPEAAITISWH